MVDVAIVGTGVAAVSAALTLKAMNRSILWLGDPKLSAKIEKAEEIRNYPGLYRTKGADFRDALLEQIRGEGLTPINDRALGVYQKKGGYRILGKDQIYEAHTVILATGVEATRSVPGEEDYVGRGVSYCAVCDGGLYRGKTIAVVCTSKRLEEEVQYLAQLAAQVYFTPLYRDWEIHAPNVTVIEETPSAIVGGERVERICWVQYGARDVQGVFLLKEAMAPSLLLHGLAMKGRWIAVDASMATNLPGCFAAGDCTGRPYQYAKAVGEGNVAAHSVSAYLSSSKIIHGSTDASVSHES